VQEVSFHWIIAGQLAQATRDHELLTLVDELHRETLTQIKWLKTQVKQAHHRPSSSAPATEPAASASVRVADAMLTRPSVRQRKEGVDDGDYLWRPRS
jgi:hypothetical protein